MSQVSPVRLLVLGVLREQGPTHGYRVRRELLAWRADYWAQIAPASIYQAMRTLTKHRMLSQVGTAAGTGGPERTVYEITVDGETELLQLVRLSISDPDNGPQALNAAFAMLTVLGRDEVANLFGYRVRALSRRLGGESAELADGVFDPKPPHVKALSELHAAQTRTEIDWAREMTSRIRDGAFAFAGEQADATGAPSPGATSKA